ncbi:GNAT family N-acetyltransferase [Solibacillus sp. R5-41]|uniref:GNAT family N-acetyltransferase n=1 Tax=Solibacillus sp. R5-41 TaxID=2048654 RepID=UPI000C126A11|nr:GNAT family N-acetyltransferase [Solibacillus sp. R5-41]ATP42408.1 GNAT family N-acetyltransferase [Solibacillus sp. R5-41]
MNIRKATLQDAQGIAKVHVDSWRTTYKGILPQFFLDNLSYDNREVLWKKNIAVEKNVVLVAENVQGEIIGFADGSTRETNLVANASDLTTIYLLEQYQGQGIGKKLLKEMMESFKERQFQTIYVDVLADNKTRYFYENYGAEYVKSVQLTIGGKVVEEAVYVWKDIDAAIEKLS